MTLPAISALADSIAAEHPTESHYEQRLQRYRHRWSALIPTQLVVQNAGNMGALAAGIGWSYGRHHWETHLLMGYIPKHQSSRTKLTMTLKENYIPWHISLKPNWQLEPLTASIYLNTVYGHEFWKSQPQRYPDDYYQFLSTKFRLNVALGQRITWQIPDHRYHRNKSVSLFYELSSCDLYIRAKFIDRHVHLSDIVGLSLGVKLQVM